jgi:hypothetical protein
MIIKRKEGYYVTGRTARVHLGGPYKKKEDAERRFDQLVSQGRLRREKIKTKSSNEF